MCVHGRFSALLRGGVIPGASTPARTTKTDSRELIHAPGVRRDARYDAEGYLRSINQKPVNAACKQRMRSCIIDTVEPTTDWGNPPSEDNRPVAARTGKHHEQAHEDWLCRTSRMENREWVRPWNAFHCRTSLAIAWPRH